MTERPFEPSILIEERGAKQPHDHFAPLHSFHLRLPPLGLLAAQFHFYSQSIDLYSAVEFSALE